MNWAEIYKFIEKLPIKQVLLSLLISFLFLLVPSVGELVLPFSSNTQWVVFATLFLTVFFVLEGIKILHNKYRKQVQQTADEEALIIKINTAHIAIKTILLKAIKEKSTVITFISNIYETLGSIESMQHYGWVENYSKANIHISRGNYTKGHTLTINSEFYTKLNLLYSKELILQDVEEVELD